MKNKLIALLTMSALAVGTLAGCGNTAATDTAASAADTAAETTVEGGKEAINTNVVAYAPSDNPQIAVAVVFPHNTNLQATVSHNITREIINLYQQKHPMN